LAHQSEHVEVGFASKLLHNSIYGLSEDQIIAWGFGCTRGDYIATHEVDNKVAINITIPNYNSPFHKPPNQFGLNDMVG
jgi:hypothetical protein